MRVVAVEDARLLGVEAELVAPVEQRRDAPEQRLVHEDRAAMARQARRDLALDRLQRVVGVAAGEVEEHRRDPAKLAAAALHRLDGVGEARRRGIAGDRLDLADVRVERPIEGRAEMLRRDALERRQLERRRPRARRRDWPGPSVRPS